MRVRDWLSAGATSVWRAGWRHVGQGRRAGWRRVGGTQSPAFGRGSRDLFCPVWSPAHPPTPFEEGVERLATTFAPPDFVLQWDGGCLYEVPRGRDPNPAGHGWPVE